MNDRIDLMDAFIEEEMQVKYNLSPKEIMEADVGDLSVATKMSEPQAMLDVAGPLAKGVVQGTLGLPADTIGLVTGLLNMLTTDPEEKGNLQQFAEGYDAVPFTSEKIAKILEDAGWSYQGDSKLKEMQQGVELGGEFLSPTKALESIGQALLKKVKT